MNYTTFENIIYGWINGILGANVIFADQSPPRPEQWPNKLYVTVKIVSDAIRGTEENEISESGGVVTNTYSSLSDIMVSINTFYTGSRQLAKDIVKSLDSIEVKNYMSDEGLGIGSVSDIRSIPSVINSRWEERAQVDINFYVRNINTETLQAIEKIEVNGTIYEKE